MAHLKGKPRVSLTAPNHDHFLPASLTVLGAFSSARAKAKKNNLRINSTRLGASLADCPKFFVRETGNQTFPKCRFLCSSQFH